MYKMKQNAQSEEKNDNECTLEERVLCYNIVNQLYFKKNYYWSTWTKIICIYQAPMLDYIPVYTPICI